MNPLVFVSALLVLPITSARAAADAQPNCGLYCIYAGIQLLGKQVDFHSLLRPEYIHSAEGSTIEELQRAAHDQELNAEPLSGLTPEALQRCNFPVILHVKQSAADFGFDHWILFVRNERGQALILDPPESPQLVTYPDLMTRWDGNGLLLSDQAIDVAAISNPQRTRLAMYVLVAVLFVGLLYLGKRRFASLLPPRSGVLCCGQAGAILALSIGGALCYNFMDAYGIFREPNAIAQIQRAYFSIGEISIDRAKALIKSGAVMIDARYQADFDQGHIPGAINIPPHTSPQRRQSLLKQIPKNHQFVVYCESAGCPFSRLLGVSLADDGFSDIAIYKSGWIEWSQSGMSRAATPNRDGHHS